MTTKANYHGLLYGVCCYALEEGYPASNPCARTAPKRSRIRQSQADLGLLSEDEFATVARLAGENADLLRPDSHVHLQRRHEHRDGGRQAVHRSGGQYAASGQDRV